MAVFTPVDPAQAEAWLERFELGPLVELEGIPSGIENTNYFLSTGPDAAAAGGRRFVLTLFERLRPDQLPFYLGLMKHLAERGIACPAPIADHQGQLFSELNGRPAALVSRLRGRADMQPTAAHCAAIGTVLGRMHLAARDFALNQPNLRGASWWPGAAADVRPFLDVDQQDLLDRSLAEQGRVRADPAWPALPASAVHADLFRDNVLFDGPVLSGVIDFYFAGVDTWLFDLAVTCNDWCIDEASGAFDAGRLAALLAAYRQERPPSDAERHAWAASLRAAALRFWLSRLHDLHLPRPAEMITPKDPRHFERILRARQGPQPEL